MSSTPLMSEFPDDKKDPIYPINESDVELVVGQQPVERRRCFWARLRRGSCCANRAPGQERKNKLRRALKFGLITFLFLSLTFWVGRHHIHPHLPWKPHPIICVPVTDTTGTVELPLASPFTRIGLGPSLAAGEAHIVHSDKVEKGKVSISFELPKDTDLGDDEPKIFACHVVGQKFVGVGVHAKGEHKKEEKHYKLKVHHNDEHPEPPHHPPHHHPHGPSIKAVKTTITLSAEEAGHPRGVSFHGPGFFGLRKIGGGCMKKRIRMAINKAVRLAKAEKDEKAFDSE